MQLRSSLLLFLIFVLSACTSTKKAPIYAGPLPGDSVRIYPLPYPVNTEADEYAPSVSHDWRWMYFGRTVGHRTTNTGTFLYNSHGPDDESVPDRRVGIARMGTLLGELDVR